MVLGSTLRFCPFTIHALRLDCCGYARCHTTPLLCYVHTYLPQFWLVTHGYHTFTDSACHLPAVTHYSSALRYVTVRSPGSPFTTLRLHWLHRTFTYITVTRSRSPYRLYGYGLLHTVCPFTTLPVGWLVATARIACVWVTLLPRVLRSGSPLYRYIAVPAVYLCGYAAYLYGYGSHI